MTACSDDTSADGSAGDDNAGSGDGEFSEAYVVSTQIFGEVTTSYLPVVPSLDVDAIGIEDALELQGRSSIAQVGDWIFAAASTAPVVTRYTVGDDGSLARDAVIDFSNAGVPEYFSIDAWGAVFVNEEKAYIFNGNDGSHVVWNPTTMEITGSIEGPDIVEEGYSMESVAVVRGNRMFRMFTFLNYDTWEFLPEPQYLAVYDVETDELLSLTEETRCAQLYATPTLDEAGNIYFSGFVWTTGLALTSDYPKSCALRVKAGEEGFDPEWMLDFADVTEGREAATMLYVGDGKALIDVFHDERATIDESTDAQELSSTNNWRIWLIDIEAKTGAPVESVDFKGAGLSGVQVGGKTYVMLPNVDWSETTAWELVGDDVVQRFTVQGNSYQILKAR